jgi:uncharacterized protein YcaQ
LKAVRTLALTAQGLTQKNGSEPAVSARGIAALVRRLNCIQIDTLHLVHRSQYLAVWSRLGCYPPGLLDAVAYGGFDDEGQDVERQLFEYWYHAACLLPFDMYRFRLARMRSAQSGRHETTREWLAKADTKRLLAAVIRRIEREGPLMARDFDDPRPERGEWWDWKPAKHALEHLYNSGSLMIAKRVRFQREYDLTRRVLPEWVDAREPSEQAAVRHILEQAALALGICELRQVADYCYDFSRPEATPHLQAMVREGVLVPVTARLADGELHELFVHHESMESLQKAAEGEIKAERTTLLSPFDTLFYPKGRDRALWGFRQVLEAYKPAPQREWGYFCLPILDRDRLVGRLDPKLERKAGRLRIEALYLEPGVKQTKQLARSVAKMLRDFMRFHEAHDLVIERSEPDGFGRSIMDEI